MHVPTALSVRLRDDARTAVAIIAASISAPHRRPVTLTDALHAALEIARDAVRARDGSTVA